jgi:hypothetical protein
MQKASILDDTSTKLERIDKSGMLSLCVDAPKHYEKAVRIAEKVVIDYPKPRINNCGRHGWFSNRWGTPKRLGTGTL